MLSCRIFFIIWLSIAGCLSRELADTVLILATNDLPPFVSRKPGESFLTEILDEVALEMNVRFVYKFMPWKRCEFAIQENKTWGMFPVSPTAGRVQKYDFSEPFYFSQSKFYYYSSSGKLKRIHYNKLSDLKGYRIGGVKGYYYEKEFREAGLNVEYVATQEQNFLKLKAGRVDLIPVNEVVGSYLIKKMFSGEISNFFTLPKTFHASGDYLITSKTYPNTLYLLSEFNSALRIVKRNGVYKRILDKYGIKLEY